MKERLRISPLTEWTTLGPVGQTEDKATGHVPQFYDHDAETDARLLSVKMSIGEFHASVDWVTEMRPRQQNELVTSIANSAAASELLVTAPKFYVFQSPKAGYFDEGRVYVKKRVAFSSLERSWAPRA